ncbi:MAG: twin-arginine translocation signal domain-containing protein, partial [Candidatus Eisenbacteria bacterium]|nr:twin-arginine translocation signal domain-containing protein [Candidatus Eisenbacteria bacterium]
MDRREFLKNSAIAATVGATTGPLVACSQNNEQGDSPNVVTQPNVQWRLASSFPRGLDTIYGAAEVLSERVEAMSGGKFKIRVYPAGEMVPALQVMDAVQQGTLQVGQTASYYFVGKNPALAFDTCVPFGLTARQQAAWLHEAGGLELMNEMFADFNIITFPCGNTGAQMGGRFKKDIN